MLTEAQKNAYLAVKHSLLQRNKTFGARHIWATLRQMDIPVTLEDVHDELRKEWEDQAARLHSLHTDQIKEEKK